MNIETRTAKCCIFTEYEIGQYKGKQVLLSCDDSKLLNLCVQIITIDEFVVAALKKLNRELEQNYPEYLLGEPPKMTSEDINKFELKIINRDKMYTIDEYRHRFFEFAPN